MSKETWFVARFGQIQPIEVVASTAQFVTLAARPHTREKKITDWCSYFPTWDGAKAWLVEKAARERNQAAARLKHYEDELAKVEALQK